ncbi:small membrane protein YdgU [Atlantibacter hermannii]
MRRYLFEILLVLLLLCAIVSASFYW